MNKDEQKIINIMQQWQKQKEMAIPNSSYYYYCYGIEQGLKMALQEISK